MKVDGMRRLKMEWKNFVKEDMKKKRVNRYDG